MRNEHETRDIIRLNIIDIVKRRKGNIKNQKKFLPKKQNQNNLSAQSNIDNLMSNSKHHTFTDARKIFCSPREICESRDVALFLACRNILKALKMKIG